MNDESGLRKLKLALISVGVLIIYCAITYIAFVPRHISWTRDIFSPNGDTTIGIWSMYWWPFAIRNSINPFVTNYIWYPTGFNLAWAGAMPTLSALGYPITWAFGAIAAYNILAISVYPLGAFSCFSLARYLTRSYPAAVIAGFLFGFSSYIVGQSLGHIVLSFVCLVPLVVLLAVRRFRDEMGVKLFVALTAACIVLEFGIYIEVVATATFFGGAYLALLYWQDRALRTRLRSLFAEIVAAYVVAALVLSPYLFYIVVGLNFVPKVINSPEAFSADLLNYFIPTAMTKIGGAMCSPLSSRFTGNLSETGAYVGIISITATIFAIRRYWGRSWIRAIAYFLIAVVACSLGPYLQIGGVNTKLPLPWLLLERVPLLGHALPTRFTLYVALAVSVILSFWLSEPNIDRRGRALRYGAVACSAAMIFPAVRGWPFGENGIPWGESGIPAFFRENAVLSRFVKDGDVVLILPYGMLGDSMLWQANSGMTFKMAGGYVGFTPKQFAKLAAVNMFFNNVVPVDPAAIKNDISSFCATHDVSSIIVGPGTTPALRAAMAKLGWKTDEAGGVEIVQVPPVAELKYSDVRGDYWQSPADWAWMGRSIRISNHGVAATFYATAQWLPPAVGPITLTVQKDGNVRRFEMMPGIGEVLYVKIGPFDSATITAERTWVPKDVIHNGDRRSLSVLFKVD